MDLLDYLIRREDSIDTAVAIATIDEILDNVNLIDIEVAVWEQAIDLIKDGESPRRTMAKARKSLYKANRLRQAYVVPVLGKSIKLLGGSSTC